MLKKIVHYVFPSKSYSGFSREIKDVNLEEICPNNWARAIVASEFVEKVIPLIKTSKICRVAVVGGTRGEPELLAIQREGIAISLEFFGIENSKKLDLNEAYPEFEEKFDLVLCSQVLEHVWNHSNAIQNLKNLLSDGGLLWLAAPASNRPHGSPGYFSAGLTSGYLSSNLKRFGLVVLDEGHVGSRRNYIAIHLLPTWPTIKANRNPIMYSFGEYSPARRVFLKVRYFHMTVGLQFVSKKLTSDISVATEAWVLAQK